MTPSRDIATLIEIMARLRTPGTGCEWDLGQTFATIAPYTVEEAYEVADAIARGDMADLCEELGDLLLQVAYHARMAEEDGQFDFGDVVLAITGKMVRRHPHVFGGDKRARENAGGAEAWARIKAAEASAKRRDGSPAAPEPPSVLDGIPHGMPALMRAQKLASRAVAVGFDWPHLGDVVAKLREEIAEVEVAAGDDLAARADEIGDVLFTAVNLARRLGVDAETALTGANAKFEHRFRFIERALAAQGRSPEAASLAEMEALWQRAKAEERGPDPDQESRRARG